MHTRSEDKLLEVLVEMRTWQGVALRNPVQTVREAALPDAKRVSSGKMLDVKISGEPVRLACKISSHAIVALTSQSTSLGLMGSINERKRMRPFELDDLGRLISSSTSNPGAKE